MAARTFLALIGLLLFGGRAAAADVTARYVMPAIGDVVMTVEADDHGNSRISVAGQPAIVTTRGVAYAIIPDGDGTVVVRREDMRAVVRALTLEAVGAPEWPSRSPAARSPLPAPAAAGTETVAGRKGQRWIMLPGDPLDAGNGDVVLSADPDLAPIGRALAAQFEEADAGIGVGVGPLGLTGNVPPSVKALVGRGTILRYAQMVRLESAGRAPIPASAFTLPAAPMTRAAFEMWLRRELARRD